MGAARQAHGRLPGSDDHSLTLIRNDGESWRPAVRVEARDYPKIDEALGALSYALSPPLAGHGVFAVVADSTPRSPSAARVIRHRIYTQPAGSADFKLAEENSESYCSGDGAAPAFGLSPDGEGVTIRYSDGSSVGTVVHQPVVRYAFVGDEVRKVVTLEQSAREFVEEWIGLASAPAAARWTEKIAPEIIACRREGLRAAGFKPTPPGSSVRVCPANACQFQIDSLRGDAGNSYLFFTVLRERDGFYVEHINNVKPVRCDHK